MTNEDFELQCAIAYIEHLERRARTNRFSTARDFRFALAALCEQAERNKGCEFCCYTEYPNNTLYPKDGYLFYAGFTKQIKADDFHEFETEKINFCPICGKRLEAQHE